MMRTALFLDFDNFFSGLMSTDPASALELVSGPSRWLQRLKSSYSDGADRRWLVLRCYMNPAGSITDPRNPSERLYFSKFRPFFTQAGVEVVDCPPLSKGSKNGADIRIAIDVMAALQANTRYDEFVIASADSDFTPLLQVLRADDRQITVIATSATAIAYESLADRFLDEQDVFDLIMPDEPRETGIETELPFDSPANQPSSFPQGSIDPDVSIAYENFSKVVIDTYSQSQTPINLARLSTDVRKHIGPAAGASAWFGAGTFVRAVQRLALPNAAFSHHCLWDRTRHQEPAVTIQSNLPSLVAQVAAVTGLPRIPSTYWPLVYQALETYAALYQFNFTESSKWSRDHTAEQGFEIPRRAFSFVARACQDGGANLNEDPSPSAEGIAYAMFVSVLRRAEIAGLEVNHVEKSELADWLCLELANDVAG